MFEAKIMNENVHYIFAYSKESFVHGTPMFHDLQFLKNKNVGIFEIISNGYSLCWSGVEKPLVSEEIKHLRAAQIMERKEGELWKIIKCKE